MEQESKNFEFQGVGLGRYEKPKGRKAFEDYCNHYHITAYSDLQLVEELVYREMMTERLKSKANSIEEKNKKENKEYTVPRSLVETMNENFNQILAIKEKLGMFENKDGQDGFNYIQQLKEKFKLWCKENQGSRTVVCPHCSKMIALFIKPETWEAEKHPFFKDKLLANKHLWKLYKEGKITKEDVAEVLGCSAKYIDWLESKIYQVPAQN